MTTAGDQTGWTLTETIMDLDTVTFNHPGRPEWAKVGMLVCFGVAVGILAFSIWMPSATATPNAQSSSFVRLAP